MKVKQLVILGGLSLLVLACDFSYDNPAEAGEDTESSSEIDTGSGAQAQDTDSETGGEVDTDSDTESDSTTATEPIDACGVCDENASCEQVGEEVTCQCADGFDGDGFDCEDIDECAANSELCSDKATCVNNPGGYACECPSGYVGDGKGCLEVDECQYDWDNCDPNAICTNTDGSFACACGPGYSGNGLECTNVNECDSPELNDCGLNAACIDLDGSYQCKCDQGFSGDGVTCSDIDECYSIVSNHQCHDKAYCYNSVGSYYCACQSGYEGDGFTCSDVDECSATEPACDLNAICTNTTGSHHCECKPGFEGDGSNCVDIDECADEELNLCSVNGTCSNTPGAFDCACNDGFSGSGYVCDNVDDCSTATCGSGRCVDSVEAYSCDCGYAYSGSACENCGVGYQDVDGDGLCLPDCTTAELSCNVHTACNHANGIPSCDCIDGYSGENCEILPACVGTVQLADAIIEQRVRELIGKPTGDIDADDLLSITSLDISFIGQPDLGGLHCAENIEYLDVSGNEPLNLAPVLNLANLKTLVARQLQVIEYWDFSSLAVLEQLQEFDFSSNYIYMAELPVMEHARTLTLENCSLDAADLSPLAIWPNLEHLVVDGNNIFGIHDTDPWPRGLVSLSISSEVLSGIDDISIFPDLVELNILDNSLIDVSPLLVLPNMRTLKIGFDDMFWGGESCSSVWDLSFLTSMTQLEELEIAKCDLFDSSLIAGAANLKSLTVDRCEWDDLAGIGTHTVLEHLAVPTNGISSLAPLSGLANLRHLDISYNPLIDDISAIGSLTELRELIIQWDDAPLELLVTLPPDHMCVGTTDFSVLGQLTQLRLLELTRCEFESSDFLNSMSLLNDLNLTGSTVIDAADLSALTMLTKLDLDGCSFSSTSFLGAMSELTYLSMKGNGLDSITSLSGLSELRHLDLSSNQISDVSPLTGLEKIDTLFLSWNLVSDIAPLSVNLGFGAGDIISIYGNLLDCGVAETLMALEELQARGVSLGYDC